jgi:hypothetical protein
VATIPLLYGAYNQLSLAARILSVNLILIEIAQFLGDYLASSESGDSAKMLWGYIVLLYIISVE